MTVAKDVRPDEYSSRGFYLGPKLGHIGGIGVQVLAGHALENVNRPLQSTFAGGPVFTWCMSQAQASPCRPRLAGYAVRQNNEAGA